MKPRGGCGGRKGLERLRSWAPLIACAGGACGEPATERAVPQYSETSYATNPRGEVTTRLHFTEITREAGIEFQHVTGAFGEKWMPETLGSGAAFFDYDSDGMPDLLLVNSNWWLGHEGSGERPVQRLYRNLGGGRFEDRTAPAGLDVSLYGMGAAVADYDGDGDPDIYLTAVGTNRLLRNDDGAFTDVTVQAGVGGDPPGGPPAWSTGAAWVDIDLDGWLDLFVCNYVRWTPETDLFTTIDGTNKSYATPHQYRGESCRLYRNRGPGESFADITDAAGVHNPDGKSLGVAVTDFNDDGWPDLVVANDTQRNFLYRNRGDGSFVDIAVRAGVAFDEAGRARAGMGVDVADLTGDGGWAIAIGNFAHEPMSLFAKIGDDLFQDRAGAAGLSRPTLIPLTFGVVYADLDLDGALDIVAANGHIEPGIAAVRREQSFAQPPQLFVGDGAGAFVDVSDLAGADFRQPLVGRGVATADIDGDGDLDLLFTANNGTPRLLRNDLDGASGIGVSLFGAAPNHRALGALVTAYAAGRTQRRFVATGSSYLAQSSLMPLYFGLGNAGGADSVVVRWPVSGSFTRVGHVAAGEQVILRETPR